MQVQLELTVGIIAKGIERWRPNNSQEFYGYIVVLRNYMLLVKHANSSNYTS